MAAISIHSDRACFLGLRPPHNDTFGGRLLPNGNYRPRQHSLRQMRRLVLVQRKHLRRASTGRKQTRLETRMTANCAASAVLRWSVTTDDSLAVCRLRAG